MDDPAGRLVDDIGDFGDGWRILVTGDDDGTALDERLVTRVTQEGLASRSRAAVAMGPVLQYPEADLFSSATE